MMYETLPFGKYRDTPVTEVPINYLQWVLREGAGEWLPDFHEEIRDEVKRRGFTPAEPRAKPEANPFANGCQARPEAKPEEPKRPPPASPPAKGVTREVVGMLIAAGRRALAAKYHPDVNPAPEALEMIKQVNHCADWLEDCKSTLRK